MTLPITVGVVTYPDDSKCVRIGLNGMCGDFTPPTARALAVHLVLEAEKAGAPPPESPLHEVKRQMKLV